MVVFGTLFLMSFAFFVKNVNAGPVLYFSDMTDGPTTGWEGSSTKGAAVSIWGNNFGDERGTSYITCGDVNLTSSTDYAEWGATTNPTTARGLQRITFWLNSSMTTGSKTISVTTSEGTSNTIPFYCRSLGSNHIYFVAINGDDNYDGLTVNTPKASTVWVRGNLEAGDIAYFRAGSWSERDPVAWAYRAIMAFAKSGGVNQYNNGTVNKSITITSYPGEVARFDSTLSEDTYACIHTAYGGGNLEYWTFSKFEMVGEVACIDEKPDTQLADPPHSTSHTRFVGNDLTTAYYEAGGAGCGMQIHAGWDGSDSVFILGNYIHDLAVDYRGGPHRSGARIYSIYLGGYGSYENVFVGWNEFGWNSCGRGFQAFGHLSTDKLDNFHFYNNYIHDTSRQSAVIGGGDGSPAYAYIGTAYIYNNIMANQGISDVCLTINGDLNGGVGGTFYVYNNTVVSPNSKPVVYVGRPGAITFKNNIFVTNTNSHDYFTYYGGDSSNCTGDHNIYYGCGVNATPSWDTSTLNNNDPLFSVSSPDEFSEFNIQSTSPAIDAGTSDVSAIVTKDFTGNSRPMDGDENGTAEYDIGAYEVGDSGGDNTNDDNDGDDANDDGDDSGGGNCFIATSAFKNSFFESSGKIFKGILQQKGK